jgi:uncharacterized protein (DUF486 family)
MVGARLGLDADSVRIAGPCAAAVFEIAVLNVWKPGNPGPPAPDLGLYMTTALLLVLSNVFMIFAWYGHLKFKDKPVWILIVLSWGLAFFEYLFQVPANRIGSTRFSLMQLKVMQECITIVVFTIIVGLLFRQMPRWNNIVSFLLILGAVYFTFNFEK